jgi:hypothetical protein
LQAAVPVRKIEKRRFSVTPHCRHPAPYPHPRLLLLQLLRTVLGKARGHLAHPPIHGEPGGERVHTPTAELLQFGPPVCSQDLDGFHRTLLFA